MIPFIFEMEERLALRDSLKPLVLISRAALSGNLKRDSLFELARWLMPIVTLINISDIVTTKA